jgi:aryl-alcohol dehydrogenase-like predicted oxidoreductase
MRHSGRRIPLGVGCGWVGRDESRTGEVDLLLSAYERGFRYYDTSRQYDESEVIVGEFIRQVPRESIFIATKSPFRLKDENGREWDFEAFKRNFYESFERLRTDYIDLFQIHDTDNYIVCEDSVLPFLEDRVREGLIGYIGMGTRSLNAHENAIICGRVKSSLSYLNYNLQNKSATHLIDVCRQHGAAFINASVFSYGMLRLENPLDFEEGLPFYLRRQREITYNIKLLCAEMGVSVFDAATQISLLNPYIDMTLIGIRREENLVATLNSLDAVIHPEQWARIFALQDEYPLMYVQDNMY